MKGVKIKKGSEKQDIDKKYYSLIHDDFDLYKMVTFHNVMKHEGNKSVNVLVQLESLKNRKHLEQHHGPFLRIYTVRIISVQGS